MFAFANVAANKNTTVLKPKNVLLAGFSLAVAVTALEGNDVGTNPQWSFAKDVAALRVQKLQSYRISGNNGTSYCCYDSTDCYIPVIGCFLANIVTVFGCLPCFIDILCGGMCTCCYECGRSNEATDWSRNFVNCNPKKQQQFLSQKNLKQTGGSNSGPVDRCDDQRKNGIDKQKVVHNDDAIEQPEPIHAMSVQQPDNEQDMVSQNNADGSFLNQNLGWQENDQAVSINRENN